MRTDHDEAMIDYMCAAAWNKYGSIEWKDALPVVRAWFRAKIITAMDARNEWLKENDHA